MLTETGWKKDRREKKGEEEERRRQRWKWRFMYDGEGGEEKRGMRCWEMTSPVHFTSGEIFTVVKCKLCGLMDGQVFIIISILWSPYSFLSLCPSQSLLSFSFELNSVMIFWHESKEQLKRINIISFLLLHSFFFFSRILSPPFSSLERQFNLCWWINRRSFQPDLCVCVCVCVCVCTSCVPRRECVRSNV